ncbi:hypothetical protein I5487_11410 [Citrobacter freundii]|nr:hypothetical protein [Citrobacter freundii]MBJ9286025.1 hypothetical protein [Citrobacter freundii]
MSHAHQVSTALQALSAVSKPKAIQTSFGSAQEPLHAGNPYQVERDDFGVIVPLSKLYKNRNLIVQICSKVRRGKHADKPLSDLLRSRASYKTRARPETNDPINYVCALAYDDMVKCEINRETTLNVCSKVEVVLRERLQRISSKHTTDEGTRYDRELNNPHSQFNTKIQYLHKLHRSQKTVNYTVYLNVLFKISRLIGCARLVLNNEGKKKYEQYVSHSACELKNNFFQVLTPAQMHTIAALLEIPPRRSTVKDLEELDRAQMGVTIAIERYRYHHIDCGYLDYAEYVAKLIPRDKPLPPSLAKLLVHEAHALYTEARTEGSCLDSYAVSSRSLWNRPNTNRQFEIVRTIIDGFLYKAGF